MGMPLAMVGAHEKVRVKSIVGGYGIMKRLSDMGIYEGTTLEVVRNDSTGPLILKVLDSRIVIGRGQAQKIMVEMK